ncbi:hypothetical protein BVRB_022640, partial [Beta vulgaris subsp. vulgaris]
LRYIPFNSIGFIV